jgi:DNA (cytosine-5)-methyltransferase 1
VNYYNDNDPRAVATLRKLIKRNLIPNGEVDERSICDVQYSDLKGFTHCHFFAGIGGWPLALRWAGWRDSDPIWTASLPCQPFSCAGKQRGMDDERHLWPEVKRLAYKRKPPIIVGEQVASAIGKGWLDVVFDDLENQGNACGSAVLRSCGVGGASERKRLYWVAARAERQRGSRLVTRPHTGQFGQRNWRGKEDLCAIAERPLERGDLWPQPIIRRVDARIPNRVGGLHGFGNAIDPRVGAVFMRSVMEVLYES